MSWLVQNHDDYFWTNANGNRYQPMLLAKRTGYQSVGKIVV
jgi:hypothetical protein